DGVTTNDPTDTDAGANQLQNYPVLGLVTGTSVHGTLRSTPSTEFRIELFVNGECDSTGHGEGAEYLGRARVITDSGGNGSFVFSSSALPGGVVTATATDPNNNTSEFSGCASSDSTRPAGAAIVVTATDAGGAPRVRVFDPTTGAEKLSFLAYDRSFR